MAHKLRPVGSQPSPTSTNNREVRTASRVPRGAPSQFKTRCTGCDNLLLNGLCFCLEDFQLFNEKVVNTYFKAAGRAGQPEECSVDCKPKEQMAVSARHFRFVSLARQYPGLISAKGCVRDCVLDWVVALIFA
jgi:hypothetical protein